MTLEEVIERIQHPEKILAITEMESVIDYCTMWIHHLEEEISDLDFRIDTKMAELAEKNSIARAEVMIKLHPDYLARKKKDLTLKSLKSYRQNIRRKRDRIVPR